MKYAAYTDISPGRTKLFFMSVIPKPHNMRKMAKWLKLTLPMCSVIIRSHRGLNLKETTNSSADSANAIANVMSDVLFHPLARKERLKRPTPIPI